MALTRSQIARALSDEFGLTRKKSAEVVAVFIQFIVRALQAGKEVRLRKFGRFKVISRAARRKANFSSEGVLSPPSRKSVRFKCSKILRTYLPDDTDDCEEPSSPDPVLEQLYCNLEMADQVQEALNAHCCWVESEGCIGRRGNFAGIDLAGEDLTGANLKFANLVGAWLPNADLGDADLENANFENANLKGASLPYARLRQANLTGACLREADLRWADLRWANLSRADLSDANLSGADLTNSVLSGTELGGARVKNTILEKKSLFSSAAVKLWLEKKSEH